MIIENPFQLHLVEQFINENETIIIDIETTGLNPRKDAIIGIGLGNRHTGIYLCNFRFNADNAKLRPTDISKADVQRTLSLLHGKKLWTFNGAFDLLFIKNYFGVDLIADLHTDVLLAAHTSNENRFQYGLKALAAEEFGSTAISAQTDMLASIKANGGSKNEYYKADTELMAKYCIQDCILTAKLGDLYIDRLRAEGLLNFFYQDEVMPLYREVTLPMVETGIRLDIPALQQAKLDIEADIEAIENRIHAAISDKLEVFTAWFLNKDYPPKRASPGSFAQGIAKFYNLPLPRTKAGKYSFAESAIEALPPSLGKSVLMQQAYVPPADLEAIQRMLYAEERGTARMFNLSSGHHLKKLFFDTLGETPLSKTPTGQPQADDDFLQAMAKKYDWAHDLQILRKLQKLNGTYISRLLEEAEGDRFYPQYKQHGTVTGRYSGDFQQLPRPMEDGHALVMKHTNSIRNFFIADAGKVLIDADYESLEPHVFAHISRDPAVIEIFNQGHDFYSTVAIRTERLEGLSADKKAPNYLGKLAKGKRQTAKSYALGIAYGEEDYKLGLELGIPQEEAKLLVQGYWSGFPVLKETSDAGKQQILRHGYISTPFGRRRRLYEAKQIADKYSSQILDSLWLWKQYNTNPKFYDYMKMNRKKLKKALNAAINFPTQGSAASIVNRAAIAFNRQCKIEGVAALIVGQCHDELIVSCLENDTEKASKILQFCMENTTKLSVKLKAEPVAGYRYGEIK